MNDFIADISTGFISTKTSEIDFQSIFTKFGDECMSLENRINNSLMSLISQSPYGYIRFTENIIPAHIWYTEYEILGLYPLKVEYQDNTERYVPILSLRKHIYSIVDSELSKEPIQKEYDKVFLSHYLKLRGNYTKNIEDSDHGVITRLYHLWYIPDILKEIYERIHNGEYREIPQEIIAEVKNLQ